MIRKLQRILTRWRCDIKSKATRLHHETLDGLDQIARRVEHALRQIDRAKCQAKDELNAEFNRRVRDLRKEISKQSRE